MTKKKVIIDGQERTLVANALLPKLYRREFGSDLIRDMKKLSDAYKNSNGDAFDSEALERLTWLMLREGGEDVGETPDEWLASLGTVFGLYELLPTVVEMWASNAATTSKPKKK